MPGLVGAAWTDVVAAAATTIQTVAVIVALIYARGQWTEAKRTRAIEERSSDAESVRGVLSDLNDLDYELGMVSKYLERLEGGDAEAIQFLSAERAHLEQGVQDIRRSLSHLPDELRGKAMMALIEVGKAHQGLIAIALAVEASRSEDPFGEANDPIVALSDGEAVYRRLHALPDSDWSIDDDAWPKIVSGELVTNAQAVVRTLHDDARVWLRSSS